MIDMSDQLADAIHYMRQLSEQDIVRFEDLVYLRKRELFNIEWQKTLDTPRVTRFGTHTDNTEKSVREEEKTKNLSYKQDTDIISDRIREDQRLDRDRI